MSCVWDSLIMFWASKSRRSSPPSGSAILSTQSLSHGLRSAPIHTCHARPWHSSRSPVDCNMPGSPQAAPASVTSLGTLKDYDPATWCQASISLHDPCNPSVPTVTQAVAPLPTASPGLFQCQVSVTFYHPFLPFKITTWQTKFSCQYETQSCPTLSQCLCTVLAKIPQILPQWCVFLIIKADFSAQVITIYCPSKAKVSLPQIRSQ